MNTSFSVSVFSYHDARFLMLNLGFFRAKKTWLINICKQFKDSQSTCSRSWSVVTAQQRPAPDAEVGD